jgi:hypothetical protein
MTEKQADFAFDAKNLYRDESYTDLKVGAIRCLIPITIDGAEDETRKKIYVGHSQLMSPQGVVPIQAELEASSMDEAIQKYPAAITKEMEKMIAQAKEMHAKQQQAQEQAKSPIIMPGS